MTKVIMAMLDRITVFVFKPRPTRPCDTKAPAMEASNNRLRPMRFSGRKHINFDTSKGVNQIIADLNEENGGKCHEDIHYGYAKRHVGS